MNLLLESFFAFTKSKPFSASRNFLFVVVGISSLLTSLRYGLLWTFALSLFMMAIGAMVVLLMVDETKGGIMEEIRNLLRLTDIPVLQKLFQDIPISQKAQLKQESRVEEKDENNLTSRSLEKIYPWMNLYAPKCVDDSLTNLFGIILNQYLTTDWYQRIQVRRNFATEVRVSMRYMASRLTRKLSRVNFTDLIHERASKILVDHITVYLTLRSHAAKTGEMNIEKLLDEHQHLSHCAMISETGEDRFFYELSTRILTSIVPQEFRKFPASVAVLREILSDMVLKVAVDALSEPHHINYLVVLALESATKEYHPGEPKDLTEVPFLKTLAVDEKSPSTVQRVPFRQILKEPTLKNTFEQHLKALGLDDFFKIHESMEWVNKVMETGVIGEAMMNSIYNTLLRLQKELAVAETKGYVFPKDFVNDIREIIGQGISGVGRLRTVNSWKIMYSKLIVLLEIVLVPGFQETRLYHHLLIPPTEEVQKRPIRRLLSQKRTHTPDPVSLQRFSEKVRGALKDVPPVVSSNHEFEDEEGNSYLPDDDFDDIDNEFAVTEDALGSTLRDLSYYHIKVSRAERRRDDRGRIFMVLNIVVKDHGPLSPDNGKEWSIQRRYSEFFILDAKIREFHGSMEASGFLPPKRAWFSPSLEYLQQRLTAFESFLISLTKEPKLRYSQMLYNFLATRLEFDASSGFPDLGLGKVMRSVPQMLTSERGQNVESFVRALLTAALPSKSKVFLENMPAAAELDQCLSLTETEQNVFSKTAFSPIDVVPTEEDPPHLSLEASSIFDRLLYVASNLLGTDPELIGLVACFRMVARPITEKLFRSKIDDLVNFIRGPEQVSYLVDLLSSTLMSTEPGADEKEIQRRKDNMKILLNSFAEKEWVQLVCGENAEDVTDLIFDIFQYKVLNRRLALTLIEALIDEVFPTDCPSDISLSGA